MHRIEVLAARVNAKIRRKEPDPLETGATNPHKFIQEMSSTLRCPAKDDIDED